MNKNLKQKYFKWKKSDKQLTLKQDCILWIIGMQIFKDGFSSQIKGCTSNDSIF